MKPLDEEIVRLESEIARLQAEKAGVMRSRALLMGDTSGGSPPPTKRRSANVKPLILDIMRAAGAVGATSGEVAATVRERVPTVAKDTVASVLSRLKADKALAHDGERYYETRFAPRGDGRPFEPRVVG